MHAHVTQEMAAIEAQSADVAAATSSSRLAVQPIAIRHGCCASGVNKP
jgi:hypothetical protein